MGRAAHGGEESGRGVVDPMGVCGVRGWVVVTVEWRSGRGGRRVIVVKESGGACL